MMVLSTTMPAPLPMPKRPMATPPRPSVPTATAPTRIRMLAPPMPRVASVPSNGEPSVAAYATHIMRMSRAIRTTTEKTDAPVLERIKDLRKAMIALGAQDCDDEDTQAIAIVGQDTLTTLKTSLDVLLLDAVLAGAFYHQSVRSLSDELMRAASRMTKDDARTKALLRRLEDREREVASLRDSLARAEDAVKEKECSATKSRTVSVSSTDSETETSDCTDAVDFSNQSGEDNAIDYKRQCAVLQGLLEGERKIRARALGEAMQRTFVLETRLTQAHAMIKDAPVAPATCACGGTKEKDTEDAVKNTTTAGIHTVHAETETDANADTDMLAHSPGDGMIEVEECQVDMDVGIDIDSSADRDGAADNEDAVKKTTTATDSTVPTTNVDLTEHDQDRS